MVVGNWCVAIHEHVLLLLVTDIKRNDHEHVLLLLVADIKENGAGCHCVTVLEA